jgi:hypothetical protein
MGEIFRFLGGLFFNDAHDTTSPRSQCKRASGICFAVVQSRSFLSTVLWMTFWAKRIMLLTLSIKGAGGSLLVPCDGAMACGVGAGFGFGR